MGALPVLLAMNKRRYPAPRRAAAVVLRLVRYLVVVAALWQALGGMIGGA